MNADDVLKRYKDEDLPDFSGIELSDVNQAGIFGDAPIHVAAIRGRTDEITALLDGGADANASGSGRTISAARRWTPRAPVRTGAWSGSWRPAARPAGGDGPAARRHHGRVGFAEVARGRSCTAMARADSSSPTAQTPGHCHRLQARLPMADPTAPPMKRDTM